MDPRPSPRRHALADAASAYGAANPKTARSKLSISLPSDVLAQVRQAATESGTSVSGVIAAALDRAIAAADQERLDVAIAVQNDENLVWADAFLPLTSKLWSEVEW